MPERGSERERKRESCHNLLKKLTKKSENFQLFMGQNTHTIIIGPIHNYNYTGLNNYIHPPKRIYLDL